MATTSYTAAGSGLSVIILEEKIKVISNIFQLFKGGGDHTLKFLSDLELITSNF